MTGPRREDPLLIDVSRDLSRIDGVFSQVIADSAVADEFVRDPNGVLSRLGMHPPAEREVHDRVNQIFYAVLGNQELIELYSDHYARFESRLEENELTLESALRRGEVQNSLALDQAAVDDLLASPDFLRRSFLIVLKDLNERRLLVGTYTDAEIEDYVDRLMQAILGRRAVNEHPVLEAWDENYGVGKEFGVGFFEVAPPVTISIPVEGFAYVTLYSEMYAWTTGHIDRTVSEALRADEGSARHLATTGAMMRLAGEVLVHASNLGRS